MRALLTVAAALFSAALFAAPAAAQERGGVELLRAFLDSTPTAQITLTRRALDAGGEVLSEGPARILLARPDKFRLEHQGAEELLIVSDGETVWTYEPDLAQAIRRPRAGADGTGALAILAGDAPEAHFQLSAAPAADADGVRWVSVTPRVDAAGDAGGSGLTVRAGFGADGELAELRLLDAFGGMVRLIVRGLTRTPPPDAAFEFDPPAGTAIVSDDG